MDISNAQLRQFLIDYFDSDELDDLCFDYFPRVQQQFTRGMIKNDQIRLLLSHCRNHGERARLIGALQELRADPFRREFELAQPVPAPTRAAASQVSRNPRQIFISHASEDTRLAHRLAQDLQQQGWQIWLAPNSIQPGEKWVDAINRGLAESGVFVLLISVHAVQSRWVKSETNIAIQWEHEGKLRFIPLQTSSRTIANIPALWQAYQYILFSNDYQSGLAHLLAKLEERPYPQPPPKQSVGQKLAALFKQIPNKAWGGIGLIVTVVIFVAWLFPLFGGGGGETTREPEATPATEVAALDTAAPTPTRQPTPAPTIATTTPTATDVPAATATPDPSDTPPPPTPTHTLPPPTPTTDPSIPPANASLHMTWTRPTDGMTMMFVPGGVFMMGSSEAEIDDAFELCEQYRGTGVCQRSWFGDETPAHSVEVDDYWLDQYEVTNSQFVLFLNEAGNQEEGGVTWLEDASDFVLIEETGGIFQPKADYADHPVIGVSWYGANAYCQWAGGELPTEAQWEYAARGEAGNVFPWGNEFDGTQLNYCDTNCEFEDWKDDTINDGYARTAPVVSYDSQSWVGAYDMAGNVWEWVADWYDSYSNASQNNPTGLADGTAKVLRGGSWNGNPGYVRSAYRGISSPVFRYYNIGFRCAVSPGN